MSIEHITDERVWTNPKSHHDQTNIQGVKDECFRT